MKKEHLIIIFYVLYFAWLFIITVLTVDENLLTYFAVGIVIFYFVFLREKQDITYFWLTVIGIVLYTMFSFKGFQLKFDKEIFFQTPVWLPMAWGTTILALKKLYHIIIK